MNNKCLLFYEQRNGRDIAVPEIDWLRRWDEKHDDDGKSEIANMDTLDFATLLEEIEHR